MRYLLILMLFYACHLQGQPSLADSVIQKRALLETLLFLSADSLKGRLTGTPGADSAANFIASAFCSAGLKPLPGNQGYFDNYTADYERKKRPAKNVVGWLPGMAANDTLVIFSAHYDHVGQKDDLPYNKEYTNEDDIYNGANDNATGVAALLELAKYYKAKNNNRYNLLFVAFSGEEMGMLGSAHLVKKMRTAVIKTMINLEMLGRPVTENCFIVSFNNNAIRNTLNLSLKNYGLTKHRDFFINDPYPDEELSRRSDHYPFALKIKNAFTIMGSSPADLYYHSVDDEYATIDVDFLLSATKNIALACEVFTR